MDVVIRFVFESTSDVECSAYQSCKNINQISTSGNIYCWSTESCIDTTIDYAVNVTCSGRGSCKNVKFKVVIWCKEKKILIIFCKNYHS